MPIIVALLVVIILILLGLFWPTLVALLALPVAAIAGAMHFWSYVLAAVALLAAAGIVLVIVRPKTLDEFREGIHIANLEAATKAEQKAAQEAARKQRRGRLP